MHVTKAGPLRTSRRTVLLARFFAVFALAFTPLASAQVTDVGGSASGTGAFVHGILGGPSTLTLEVTGTPQTAMGPVALTTPNPGFTFTGEARCIAIDETPTGFRASISGEVTGGLAFAPPFGVRGFRLTVYDNTPSLQPDQVGERFVVSAFPITDCIHDFPPEAVVVGDYLVTPEGACPSDDDEDNDGLTDESEKLVFLTLLGNSDSDSDGIADGNDDANGNGEDDEDEDDEDDGCPDADSDDDGEDDEDEDDDEEGEDD
jgi:hypothetical protein